MFTRKRAILLLTLTSVILITLDLRGSAAVSNVRSAFGTIFRPVESAVRVVSNPVSNVWHGITNYNDVVDENRRLRDVIARQEGAAIANIATLREAQELLVLNGLPTLAGIDSCNAKVVGQTPSNFSQTVEINQGADCGIKVGMPVLNGAGLIGKVTDVFPDRAVVMLVTDPAYSLAVKIINEPPTTTTTEPLEPGQSTVLTTTTTTEPPTTTVKRTTTTTIAGFTPGTMVTTPTTPSMTTSPGDTTPGQGNKPQITVPPGADLPLRETGAMEGRGIGKAPVIRFVETQSRFGGFTVGSKIITAGGATSLAPPDIVVGTVSRVITRSGSLGPLLEVKLTANLDYLNFVRILLYQPSTEKK